MTIFRFFYVFVTIIYIMIRCCLHYVNELWILSVYFGHIVWRQNFYHSKNTISYISGWYKFSVLFKNITVWLIERNSILGRMTFQKSGTREGRSFIRHDSMFDEMPQTQEASSRWKRSRTLLYGICTSVSGISSNILSYRMTPFCRGLSDFVFCDTSFAVSSCFSGICRHFHVVFHTLNTIFAIFWCILIYFWDYSNLECQTFKLTSLFK